MGQDEPPPLRSAVPPETLVQLSGVEAQSSMEAQTNSQSFQADEERELETSEHLEKRNRAAASLTSSVTEAQSLEDSHLRIDLQFQP